MVQPKITDPIDERTTAERVAAYPSKQLYVPDLPVTKVDRLGQFRVGNIPKFALST